MNCNNHMSCHIYCAIYVLCSGYIKSRWLQRCRYQLLLKRSHTFILKSNFRSDSAAVCRTRPEPQLWSSCAASRLFQSVCSAAGHGRAPEESRTRIGTGKTEHLCVCLDPNRGIKSDCLQTSGDGVSCKDRWISGGVKFYSVGKMRVWFGLCAQLRIFCLHALQHTWMWFRDSVWEVRLIWYEKKKHLRAE